MNLRNAVLRVALVSFAAVLPYAAHLTTEPASAQTEKVEKAEKVDPAVLAMLGNAVPADRVEMLSRLRAAPEPGNLPGSGAPFLTMLRDTGSPGSPKFEASGVVLDLRVDGYNVIRFENARVALIPAADGRTCRFELSGSPFGPTSKFDATGTIEWKAGPAGGDKLDIEYRLDDASVEAIRTWAPTRMDPSFSGVLGVRGKATGVVGERTTEDAPATPLKGEFDATLDWTALGRTAPMTIKSQYSLDDRMVRFLNGRMSWLEESVDLKGWAETAAAGKFDLIASFANVDTAAVATRWNVPPAWRMASTLSGFVTLRGTPGEGLMGHEAKSSLITVPGVGGYDIRLEDVKLKGSLVAINTDISVSVRANRVVIGGIDLGALPVGVRWWKNELRISNSNSSLFGGINDGSLAYDPVNHPAFSVEGRIKNTDAPVMVKSLAPWLDLDVGGVGSIAIVAGQDKALTPRFSFHGSLSQGRLGGADLFGATLAALAKVDPAFAVPDGTSPVPRKGTGTRVDRAFFEADRKGEVYDIGGLFLLGGGFRLDGDGQFTRAGGLKLDGTVSIPAEVADKLVAAAPWVTSLRRGSALFVPVTVSGPLSSLSVALDPGYAELIAKARRGETVEAPGIRQVRHAGPDDVAIIPVDPKNEQLE